MTPKKLYVSIVLFPKNIAAIWTIRTNTRTKFFFFTLALISFDVKRSCFGYAGWITAALIIRTTSMIITTRVGNCITAFPKSLHVTITAEILIIKH